MYKVLFIASHRKDRAPGQRFRFEQYFSFLQEQGIHCELSNIISEKDDQYLYSKGNYLKKALFTFKSHLIRLKDLQRAKDFDAVFLFREALMTRSTFYERQFKKKGLKMIFDFDDAIWLQNVSDVNKRFAWLKNPMKTPELIKLVDMVFAGNQFLANYSLQFNSNVKIIPTTIDTAEYSPEKKEESDKICIGWSGSITTIQHFEYAIPILRSLKAKYGNKLIFKVIGDANYQNEELGIQGIAWNKKDEVKELSTFDLGIMPLPNDKWANGKCGLKGLQYMALEIPTIMSPVGVNTEIIDDGMNGFLADKEEEWLEKASQLIESKELRLKMGKAARERVIEKYSLASQKENYLNYITELIKDNI